MRQRLQIMPASFLPVLVSLSFAIAATPGIVRGAAPSTGEVFRLERSLEGALYAYGVRNGPLLREITRQSSSVEAREELGLKFSDAWLDRESSLTAPDRSLDIVISPGKANLIELLHGAPPRQEVIAQWTLSLPEKQSLDYVVYLSEMTRLAQGEIAAAVAKFAGDVEPRKLIAVEPTAIHEAVAALAPIVDEMTFTTQFATARSLHQLIERHGELPELIGPLVRAYAHLGILTEPYCSQMHCVFKARALVYAQRWVVKESQSSRSLAHRAYALALAGLPKNALDDLAEIKRRVDAPLGDSESVPAWTAMIDDFCCYRLGALGQVDLADPHRQLAAILRYIALTRTADTERIVQGAVEAQAAVPECYAIVDDFDRAIDRSSLFDYPDVNWEIVHSQLSAAQRDVLGKNLYARLKVMPELPAAVREVLEAAEMRRLEPGDAAEYALRGRVIAALLQVPAEDDVLSWPLLGRIVQEISFRQALMSLKPDDRFLDMSSTFPEKLPTDMLPLVAEHPLRSYFDARNAELPQREKVLTALATTVDADAVEFETMKLLYIFSPSNRPYRTAEGAAFYSKAATRSARRDEVVRDRYVDLGSRRMAGDRLALDRLLRIDPFLPNAVQTALMFHADRYTSRFESWKSLMPDHPDIEALLVRHLAAATPEKEEVALAAAFAKLPDFDVALRLSRLQLDRGDVDAWEQTMRSYIDRAPRTEGALRACCSAASMLVHRRLFQRAVPFVEAAMEREYLGGYRAATAVYEGLQDWQAAEKAVQVWSTREDDSSCEWYFFCKRTGFGDREAAYELADDRVRARRVYTANCEPSALFALLQNEPETALAYLRNDLIRTDDPFLALHAAILCDGFDQASERDRFLTLVRERGPKFHVGHSKEGRVRTGLIELGKLIEADLARGGSVEFDRDVLEKLRSDYPADRGDFDCLLGLYYDRRGKSDLAADSWLRCMASTNIVSFSRTLAGYRLGDWSVAPDRYRDALQGLTAEEKQEKP